MSVRKTMCNNAALNQARGRGSMAVTVLKGSGAKLGFIIITVFSSEPGTSPYNFGVNGHESIESTRGDAAFTYQTCPQQQNFSRTTSYCDALLASVFAHLDY